MIIPWQTAAALILAGLGAAAGYALKGRLDEGRIARAEAAAAACERAAAEEERRAAEAAAARLAAAQEAERAAWNALRETRKRRAATEKRLKESLYALPTAQSCGLSGAARRVLNDRLAAEPMPAGAAELGRAAAGASADSGISEADLGSWIADAISRYDECRARINAIREWDEVTHGR